jgi:hypothetical protein
MGAKREAPSDEPPVKVPIPPFNEKFEKPKPTPPVVEREPGEDVDEETRAAEAALQQLAQAERQLNENLGQGSPEGERGSGGGGTGTSGRGARVARWVLRFQPHSSQHYLEQLDGLGAEIAFPAAGNQWQYFFHVGSPRRRSEIRDLGGENRFYWVDKRPQSVSGVARVLGIPASRFMIVFLPDDLEKRMLKLELDHRGLTEEQILQTDFLVITAPGGNYDVKVDRQLPR